MRTLLVVEGEELVESSEPPTVFFVGVVESFDLAVGLWPPNSAEAVLDVVVVKIAFECMVETRSLVFVGVDEPRTVVCDDFENRDR